MPVRALFAILVSLVSMLGLVCLSAPAVASSATATATAARLAGDDTRTRLVVDFDTSPAPRAFALADPYRIVIDLPASAFAFPDGTGAEGRGLVQRWRFGRIALDRSRIVVDLARPAAIDKVYVLDPVDGQPARLVLDLVATDRDTFLRAMAIQRLAGLAPDGTMTDPPTGAVEKGDKLPVGSRERPLIVLDPGHGGIDSGAVTPNGDMEKAIVLEFALVLAEKINAAGHYRVLLTRADDTFLSLSERVRIARDAGAALFVSIHADALSDPFGVRGATIYTLSNKASDEAAARYAERENQADAIAGVDLSSETDAVADILVDLTRRETRTFSSAFARMLATQLRSAATLNRNPLRSAGFRVLMAPDVPSVLLELGYLSSPSDVELLTSPEWRRRTAAATLQAIDAFLREREEAGVNGLPPVPKP